jgi:glucose-6-phosphate dehydrogenase assembly protein OpcA
VEENVSFVPGIPVPMGGIEKELGTLWKESGEEKTRASLINLAIYNEQPGSLESNSAIVGGLAGEHPMRAILVEADPHADGSSAEAWINMHCYPRGPKGGAVCSEQVSFRLAGEAARSLQSVVFSHLDSDLPLVLWWQAGFRPPVKGKLWRWVDRLLFDSRHWQDPAGQFANVTAIAGLSEARMVLCDLNWARSLPVRRAIAGLFDTPGALGEIPSLVRFDITHAPGFRTTALLLGGWLADRLGWTLASAERGEFLNSSGQRAALTLRETEGNSIGRLSVASADTSFEVVHEPGSDCYATSIIGANLHAPVRMVRAAREETREILLAELARGGSHPLYPSAIRALGSLWG